MKIVFDLTPIYDHLSGIERYNMNITKEIIKHHPENRYVLLFKNEIHKEFTDIVSQKNVKYRVIPACNKLLFIQFRLLAVLNKIKADYIFLSPPWGGTEYKDSSIYSIKNICTQI